MSEIGTKESKETCQVCNKAQATTFCFTCPAEVHLFCDKCDAVEHQCSAGSLHKRMILDDCTHTRQEVLQCSKHSKVPSYFCTGCQETLCVECVLANDTHKGHDIIKLEQLRSAKRTTLQADLGRLREKQGIIAQLLAADSQSAATLNSCLPETVNSISTQCTLMQDAVRLRAKTLEDGVRAQHERMTSALQSRRAGLERLASALESSEQAIACVLSVERDGHSLVDAVSRLHTVVDAHCAAVADWQAADSRAEPPRVSGLDAALKTCQAFGSLAEPVVPLSDIQVSSKRKLSEQSSSDSAQKKPKEDAQNEPPFKFDSIHMTTANLTLSQKGHSVKHDQTADYQYVLGSRSFKGSGVFSWAVNGLHWFSLGIVNQTELASPFCRDSGGWFVGAADQTFTQGTVGHHSLAFQNGDEVLCTLDLTAGNFTVCVPSRNTGNVVFTVPKKGKYWPCFVLFWPASQLTLLPQSKVDALKAKINALPQDDEQEEDEQEEDEEDEDELDE